MSVNLTKPGYRMMLTFGRVVRWALATGAVAVLPLSTAAASTPFGSTTNSCSGGSLNICLGFNFAQIGNTNTHYSLDLILDALNAPHSGGSAFGSFGAGAFFGLNLSNWDFKGCSRNCDDQGEDGDGAHGLSFGSDGPLGSPGVGLLDVTGPTTTAPEPASLFLVGTGLAGLGGVGAVRRRCQRD